MYRHISRVYKTECTCRGSTVALCPINHPSTSSWKLCPSSIFATRFFLSTLYLSRAILWKRKNTLSTYFVVMCVCTNAESNHVITKVMSRHSNCNDVNTCDTTVSCTDSANVARDVPRQPINAWPFADSTAKAWSAKARSAPCASVYEYSRNCKTQFV